MDDAPGQDSVFMRHRGSLALYRRSGAGQDYWESYWKPEAIRIRVEVSRSGDLGELTRPFLRWLPRDGRILEAGCGNGRFLVALRSHGFQMEGIDFARTTVERLKQADASLDVRVGDVYAIDAADGAYAGYVSIGVLEHRFDGCAGALREAHRVLRPGGIAMISVPYLNQARRRVMSAAAEATAAELPGGLRFYQDHLDVDDFADQLRQAGFEIVELFPYLLFGGLVRDWRVGRWLHERHFFSDRLRKLVKRACVNAPLALRMRHSHMMMFVSRRA